MVWKKLTKKDLAQTKEHFASSGRVMQWYAMASEVILATLGPDWWKKNCLSASSDPDEFLRTDDLTEEGRFEHQDRIVRLGHMLYALKSCEGFVAFITSLKSRELAATFFELWVANILAKNGHEIIFVETTGVRGRDYDLIASRDGRELYIEAKSRRSTPIRNGRTLANALGKARKQLPNTGSSVVFVEIPVEWTMDDDAEMVVGHTMNSFFRNTSRVNGVVVCWHKWIELEPWKASATLVRQYDNPNPRTPMKLGTIVNPIDTSILPNLASSDFRPSFW
jgi:hypothetical protein